MNCASAMRTRARENAQLRAQLENAGQTVPPPATLMTGTAPSPEQLALPGETQPEQAELPLGAPSNLGCSSAGNCASRAGLMLIRIPILPLLIAADGL